MTSLLNTGVLWNGICLHNNNKNDVYVYKNDRTM